jgi:hypothetical protein
VNGAGQQIASFTADDLVFFRAFVSLADPDVETYTIGSGVFRGFSKTIFGTQQRTEQKQCNCTHIELL